MRSADVIIAGAGVVGASVAWHLRRLGVREVLLLEREARPGLGSTGRATGGFRAQYGTAINVRLSLLAREKLMRFAAETGVDPGYQPVGYLWLARTPEHLDMLREAQRVQHAEGLLEARLVDAREIASLNPHVRIDDVIGGAFCPSDGFIRPLEILRGYLGSLEVRCDARVTGLRRSGSRIDAVEVGAERIPCGAVVDAAGAWASEIARLAGIDLPVAAEKREVACTVPTAALPAAMPMTIWVDDGFHLRVRDGQVLLLSPDFPSVLRAAHERVPALRGVAIERTWDGLYEMSPDRHAILGAAPGCENLYFANGSSGHGVMHAPALGQLLAELIVHGQARALDVTPLRPSRFAEGAAIVAPDLL